MGYEAERDVVRQKALAAATAVYGATPPVSWDAFNGKTFAPQEGVAYCRPRVEDGQSEWAAISGSAKKMFHYATLIFEIFEPALSGDELGNRRADGIIAEFKDYVSGGVRFGDRAFSRFVGDDGKYAKWMVFLPYYREENV